MASERRYHPLVADDLSAAVSYYDHISVELGNGFRSSIRARIRDVSERPESFGRIHDEMRAVMIDRFPYVVLFEYRDESVFILGVFHAASDQKGWFERAM